MLTGFSPRKRELTVYLMAGLDSVGEMRARLGPHRASSGSCLYLKRLSGIDLEVLEAMIRTSVEHLRETYPDEPRP
jgi:hypothetical protein